MGLYFAQSCIQEKRNKMKDESSDELKGVIHFSEESENVLVTGGTGFVGQQLIQALLANGQRVTLLSRDVKRAARLFDGKVHCISSMSELPAHYPIDVIINLAGARILGWRWTRARQTVLRRSRVDVTQSLLAWIQQAVVKPRLLLSASAIGYYGIQQVGDTRSLNEASLPQNIFMSQLCQEWEAAASAASAHGVLVRRMRFGLILGQQGALPMMLLPIKLGLGGALGRGTQSLSWIHIHDVLAAIAYLWQLSKQSHTKMAQDEAINFTAPHCVSQQEFSQIAAKQLHRPHFFPTPAWPMRLMLGEQADLLLEGQRVEPQRLFALGFKFNYPQLESALEDLMKQKTKK